MENTTLLYAVQNYERTRLIATLFFTECDDAQRAAIHKEPAHGPGFDYTRITEFEVEDRLLEEIRMTDTDALVVIMAQCKISNLNYFT